MAHLGHNTDKIENQAEWGKFILLRSDIQDPLLLASLMGGDIFSHLLRLLHQSRHPESDRLHNIICKILQLSDHVKFKSQEKN